jgi:N-acetylglutamate synthase-like GNAT family acetyltransferase
LVEPAGLPNGVIQVTLCHQLMTEQSFHFRRATLEDIDILRGLWQTALYPTQELEKRLTEFQIAEGLDGRLLGALGIGVLGEEAWIHHEAFTHPDTEAAIREVLWNRLKVLFGNQGVHRIWTCEKSEFWAQAGFRIATIEERPKFPPEFGSGGRTLTVFPLKDLKAERMIESKIIELQEVREEEAAHMEGRTRIIRIVAWSLAGFLMVLLIYFTVRGLLALPQIQRMR